MKPFALSWLREASKLLLAGIGAFVLTPSSAATQTLNIEHQPVACAVAEKFPRLEARFAPADGVAAARVLFQAEHTQQWYAVAMKSEGAAFSGVLPKPKKSLKAYHYYIEVTDKALGTNRTVDYTTSVVGSAGECQGKTMAMTLASASVLLQAPAGAAALPAGFASAGVVAAESAVAGAGAAAGSGLGTGAIVGIVAGAGAVVGGVVVAAGKSGDSSSSATSTRPTPTPSPSVACPACYAGVWRLLATVTSVASPPLCENRAADVGKVQTIAPVTFNPDGSIVYLGTGTDGFTGAVDAAGNFRFNLSGDPPGSGLTCPPGQATGRCTTVTSCNGAGTQGGDTYSIVLNRQ